MSAGDREAVIADLREFISHAVKGVRGKNMLAVIDSLARAAPAEWKRMLAAEMERVFALALLAEGADVRNRVTTRYLELRNFSSIIPSPRPGGEARETQTQAYVRATAAPEGREEKCWQPIATAPKDATRILVYIPGARLEVREVWCAMEWEGGPQYWSTPIPVQGGKGTMILLDSPTHWMPLPPPPATGAE